MSEKISVGDRQKALPLPSCAVCALAVRQAPCHLSFIMSASSGWTGIFLLPRQHDYAICRALRFATELDAKKLNNVSKVYLLVSIPSKDTQVSLCPVTYSIFCLSIAQDILNKLIHISMLFCHS